MKKRYLIPILLVILIVGGMLGAGCNTSSKLTADEYEQQIIELQRQNEELRQQLDALSAVVEGIKQEQSQPSYQPPPSGTSRSNDSWGTRDIQRSINEMEEQMKQRETERRLEDLEHKQKYGW